jgi:hypothetical protein
VIIALFRVANRYVGNSPRYRACFRATPSVVRNTDTGRELAMMR